MELSECREDERSAQNQIVQVISTAGTVLSVIFGVSSYLKEIDARWRRCVIIYFT